MSNLWFDRQGNQISVAKANELLGDYEYKVVARHEEDGYTVSTVWLALDHNWTGGPPLLFETMIFGPESWQDEYCERWPTEVAASTSTPSSAPAWPAPKAVRS